ncbi:hypothetical protein ACFL6E_06650 [Candidatus Neomarinimicrobiota bacterium]
MIFNRIAVPVILVLSALSIFLLGDLPNNPSIQASDQPDHVITYIPDNSQLAIDNYRWSVGLVGLEQNRYAAKDVQYVRDIDKGLLTVTNQPQHQIILQSMPYKYSGGAHQILLHIEFDLAATYVSKSAYEIKVYLYDALNRVMAGQHFVHSGEQQMIEDTLSVPASTKRTKVLIVFDEQIQEVRLDSLSLQWNSGDKQIKPLAPAYLVQPRKTLYAAHDTVVLKGLRSSGMNHTILEWSIMDESGAVIREGLEKAVQPNITVDSLSLGWYRFVGDYGEGSLESPYRTETVFLVLPDSTRSFTATESPFGVHVEMNRQGLETARWLGAKWVRLHGPLLKWKTVEPSSGQYIWPDAILEQFHGVGFDILAILGNTPFWASANPEAISYPHKSYYFGPAAYLPKDMQAWTNYVERVVQRYDHLIDHWEIWNEPDIHFLVADDRGKADNYYRLLKAAHEAVKTEVDNRLVAPAMAYYLTDDTMSKPAQFTKQEFRRYRDPDFYANLSNLLNPGDIDIFSFHHYSRQDKNFSRPMLLGQAMIREKIGAIDASISGLDGKWITEYNTTRSNTVTPQEQARLAQQMCMEHFEFLALGIDRIFAYSAVNNNRWYDSYANFYTEYGPSLSFQAYAIMTWLLDGYRFESTDFTRSQNERTYRFISATGDTLTILCAPEDSWDWTATKAGTLIDYLGRSRVVLKGEILSIPKHNFYYFSTGAIN